MKFREEQLEKSEVWKDVKGFEGLYEVSCRGRVRGMKRQGTHGGVLRPHLSTKGYMLVDLLIGHEVVEDEPIGRSGPVGPKGMPGLCPKCGKYEGLEWDRKTDASCCNLCGWTDQKEASEKNPCKECKTGLVSIETYGSRYCQETCEQYKKYQEEANMDKPRICEVLEVEVDEEFTIGENQYFIDKSGDMWCVTKNGEKLQCGTAICWAINHPERIIRKTRFTEQEVEDAKILARALLADGFERDKMGDVFSTSKTVSRTLLDSRMFPSILPGQSYTLEEIIGGAE